MIIYTTLASRTCWQTYTTARRCLNCRVVVVNGRPMIEWNGQSYCSDDCMFTATSNINAQPQLHDDTRVAVNQ